MLSEDAILKKTQAKCLEDVKNLNVWGAKLTDISIVSKLKNVEVLALSMNNITTLKPLTPCWNLKELYLRKNDIGPLAEVGYLRNLPLITTLWLADNPCAKHPNYRLFTIRSCARLEMLDNAEVTKEEREQAQQLPTAVLNDILTNRDQDNGRTPEAQPPVDTAPDANKKRNSTSSVSTTGEAARNGSGSGSGYAIVKKKVTPLALGSKDTSRSSSHVSPQAPVRKGNTTPRKKSTSITPSHGIVRGSVNTPGVHRVSTPMGHTRDDDLSPESKTGCQQAMYLSICALLPELNEDLLEKLNRDVTEYIRHKKRTSSLTRS